MTPGYKSVFLLLLVAVTLHARDIAHTRVQPSREHVIKNVAELETDYWLQKAQATLAEKLEQLQPGKKPPHAKNIIMFLGDGMSVHTVTAARNLQGDSSEQVYFEKFPYFGLSKTYCVDRQVADSACTATAYLGGVKANYATIGVNAQVKRYNCTAGLDPANHVHSIAKWAQDAGKDTGLVTTARVTHASPAGLYAHTASRDWECDTAIEEDNCSKVNVDIARQLVEWDVGRRFKVIMGGGRRNFLDKSTRDEEGMRGTRSDGRNLIQDWLAEHRGRNKRAEYAWCRKGLRALNLNETDYLLGLFSSSHCPYHGDLQRSHLELADPSLTEMTEAAIRVLQRNDKGFFLFVEGGRIDMAHHDTKARKALEDTLEFANAIRRARELTSDKDTLIVVTSDHAHTMTINGYAHRDQDITGLADEKGQDGLPYTILSYANGPGFHGTYSNADESSIASVRTPLTDEDTYSAAYMYPASVPLSSETHGGDDVGVFASGPYAEHFSGTYEQSHIPVLMARAANLNF